MLEIKVALGVFGLAAILLLRLHAGLLDLSSVHSLDRIEVPMSPCSAGNAKRVVHVQCHRAHALVL